MRTIEYLIWTYEDISKASIAEHFFKKTEELDIAPEYMSEYEPVNKPYDLESAVKMWTHEEEGLLDTNTMTYKGKAGSMLARSRKKSIDYDVMWYREHKKKHRSLIMFSISVTKYKKYKDEMFQLFQDTVALVNAAFAFVSHSIAIDRQHYSQKGTDKLWGVFWCNYYGEKYVDMIGSDKIENFDWYDISKTESGYYTFLCENVLGDALENPKLEEKAKLNLGDNIFVSFEDAVETMLPIEIKKIDFTIPYADVESFIEAIFSYHSWLIDYEGNRIKASDLLAGNTSKKEKFFIVNSNTELDFDNKRATAQGCAKLGFLNVCINRNLTDELVIINITYYRRVKYEGVNWYAQPDEYEELYYSLEKFIKNNYDPELFTDVKIHGISSVKH